MISTPSPSKAALDVAIKEFKRSVEITRDVRFQANLRLVSRSRASSYIIALLSTYVIALSLVPNIMFLANYQSQLLLACSIVLSVFVIFTSLIDGAQNFYHHGEMLHACARKVATIYHELKLIDTAGDLAQATAAFIELQERYKLALDECPVNHDNVDYFTEMANKPHLFPDNFPNWPRFCVVFWNRARIIYFKNLWLAPHLFAIALISWIVWAFVLSSAPFIHANPLPLLHAPPPTQK